MKTNKLLLTCGALAGIAALPVLSGCKSSGAGASTEPGGASGGQEVSNMATQKAEFLFVQNARDVSFDNGIMTLHGVNPVTVCFTDRPERIAGHMPTSKIVPMWKEGTDSFTADQVPGNSQARDSKNLEFVDTVAEANVRLVMAHVVRQK
jgi:hypothetical protein